MAATRRLRQLVDSAQKRTRIPEGPVIVALSGGADSASLALLAAETAPEISAVHVDHGFEASESLAAAAAEVAEVLGLRLETISVDVAPGPSLEAQAREARYAALSTIGGSVLTGHTRDDVVETMLINLVRGTGIDGLSGIPYHRPPNTYRPILGVTRSETREMAVLAKLPFRDDPTNDDLAFTRNHIRHSVLPRMRELNPRLDDAMARAASSLRADGELLDALADSYLSVPLEVGLVTTLPRPVADRVVRRWLAVHGVATGSELLERVWSVVSGGSDSQDLAGGRRAVRDRAVVIIE